MILIQLKRNMMKLSIWTNFPGKLAIWTKWLDRHTYVDSLLWPLIQKSFWKGTYFFMHKISVYTFRTFLEFFCNFVNPTQVPELLYIFGLNIVAFYQLLIKNRPFSVNSGKLVSFSLKTDYFILRGIYCARVKYTYYCTVEYRYMCTNLNFIEKSVYRFSIPVHIAPT